MKTYDVKYKKKCVLHIFISGKQSDLNPQEQISKKRHHKRQMNYKNNFLWQTGTKEEENKKKK